MLKPVRTWLLIGAGLTVAFIGHWLQVNSLQRELAQVTGDLDKVTENRDAWQRASEHLAQELIVRMEELTFAQAAARELAADLHADDETIYAPIRQAIRAAPHADDGQVAPVLRDTLEALP